MTFFFSDESGTQPSNLSGGRCAPAGNPPTRSSTSPRGRARPALGYCPSSRYTRGEGKPDRGRDGWPRSTTDEQYTPKGERTATRKTKSRSRRALHLGPQGAGARSPPHASRREGGIHRGGRVSGSTIDYHRGRDREFPGPGGRPPSDKAGTRFRRGLKRARGGGAPIIGGKFKDEIITGGGCQRFTRAISLRAHRRSSRTGRTRPATTSGTGGVIVPGAPATINDGRTRPGDLARGPSGRPTGEGGRKTARTEADKAVAIAARPDYPNPSGARRSPASQGCRGPETGEGVGGDREGPVRVAARLPKGAPDLRGRQGTRGPGKTDQGRLPPARGKGYGWRGGAYSSPSDLPQPSDAIDRPTVQAHLPGGQVQQGEHRRPPGRRGAGRQKSRRIELPRPRLSATGGKSTNGRRRGSPLTDTTTPAKPGPATGRPPTPTAPATTGSEARFRLPTAAVGNPGRDETASANRPGSPSTGPCRKPDTPTPPGVHRQDSSRGRNPSELAAGSTAPGASAREGTPTTSTAGTCTRPPSRHRRSRSGESRRGFDGAAASPSPSPRQSRKGSRSRGTAARPGRRGDHPFQGGTAGTERATRASAPHLRGRPRARAGRRGWAPEGGSARPRSSSIFDGRTATASPPDGEEGRRRRPRTRPRLAQAGRSESASLGGDYLRRAGDRARSRQVPSFDRHHRPSDGPPPTTTRTDNKHGGGGPRRRDPLPRTSHARQAGQPRCNCQGPRLRARSANQENQPADKARRAPRHDQRGRRPTSARHVMETRRGKRSARRAERTRHQEGDGQGLSGAPGLRRPPQQGRTDADAQSGKPSASRSSWRRDVPKAIWRRSPTRNLRGTTNVGPSRVREGKARPCHVLIDPRPAPREDGQPRTRKGPPGEHRPYRI